MGDFGKILDEWEAAGSGARKPAAEGRSNRSPTGGETPDRWFEQQFDRYPVVDKDAESEPEPSPDELTRPEKLPVQDSIDLHGHTVAEAIAATEAFLSASVARGLRKVVVIHGKGRDGDGVLKREVRAYLERHRNAGAMGYARGPDGGRGALWVILRGRGR